MPESDWNRPVRSRMQGGVGLLLPTSLGSFSPASHVRLA
jgi:hypothetical protein